MSQNIAGNTEEAPEVLRRSTAASTTTSCRPQRQGEQHTVRQTGWGGSAEATRKPSSCHPVVFLEVSELCLIQVCFLHLVDVRFLLWSVC